MSVDTVCLLIHGYLGTPFEMLPFVEPLRARGLDTRLVTLPGHASTLDEFRKTSYPLWLRHVETEFDRAQAEYRQVILIGYSLGGSLSLDVAARRKPRAVVTISSPVLPPHTWPRQARDWGLLLLPVLRFFVKELPSRPGRPESRAIAPWEGYEAVAHPPQLYSLFKGVGKVRKKLRLVEAPLLTIHDLRDRVVIADNALRIAAGVSSESVELKFTRVRENVTSHHTVTTHRESSRLVTVWVADFAAEFA